MTRLPKITDRAIRERVGERNVEKGEEYHDSGAVFNARRQGNTLKACCQGTSGGPYHVEVTLDEDGIVDADCSCPVGDGGSCKHVAAVLLTWKNRPGEFTEVEEMDAALAKRSREELIALIKLMLRREPDLEVLLDAPLPGVRAPGTPVKPDAYRRQAEIAFQRDTFEWGAVREIADELEEILEAGKAFLEQKDFHGALAVYEGVLEAVLEHFESIHDEPGDLHRVVGACVDGLDDCLEPAQGDPARREAILRKLFDVYCLDVEMGGVGLSGSVPDFAEVSTPEERRLMAGWVREAMSSARASRDWGRGAFGGLLLDLEADTMDDETYLRVCRETGRRPDLVERLLQIGRTEEAVRDVEQAQDHELIQLADLFVQHRHGDIAERLMQARAEKAHGYHVSHLLEWLKKRVAQRHDQAAVLQLSEKIFRVQPSLEDYKELKKLATQQQCWAELAPQLRDFLKQPKHRDILIWVYLEEEEIDQALEAIKGKPTLYGFEAGLELEVARAAEKTRPQAAREIYRKYAAAAIQGRSRASYQSACGFLKKVRDQYRHMGDEAGWTAYVRDLREKHRSLRALMDEMNKAKL
jgi:uncharacterized Zn finger protein